MVQTLERLVDDPRIYPSRAKRSASRLLTGLDKLGLSFDGADGTIENLPPRVRVVIGENHFKDFILAFSPTGVPFATTGYNDQGLIHDSYQNILSNSNYTVEALTNNHGQPLRMHLQVSPKADTYTDTYKLALVTPFALNAEPILLESLPQYFTSVGFQYNLSDPEVRDYLSDIAQTRISSSFVNSERRSIGQGKKTSNGFDTSVHLYLQDAGSAYSDCYEAEAFSNGEKIDPTTLFPEAEWQERQNHHCINKQSVPRIPANMNEVSRLTMFIDYNGNSSVLHDLFGDLPLSIDGTDQWYAKRPFVRGSLELFFKPKWGENNTALVYRQESQKRITPKQIYEAVEGMVAVKSTLIERLAK